MMRILHVVLFSALLAGWLRAEIFLPGTQPEEGGIEFAKVAQCRFCHSGTDNGEADPFVSWESGMMSQAARDPVFRAALAIANQEIAGVGEFCIRCHSPRGWLEGRSKAADGSGLNAEDMHGISCDVCHRLVDPLSDEGKSLVEHAPPGRGNGMYVADPRNVVRGPYEQGMGAMPHATMKYPFLGESEFCATCHNISNPLYAEDVKTQSPHVYSHIERTYSEWLLSDFAKEGEGKKTCQGCHYEIVEGGGEASRYGGLRREYFVKHGPVGGSTWAQDAVYHIWQGEGVSKAAMDLGKRRTQELLRTAASLEITVPDAARARIRVTNLTGHKLPTGYIEGRRMWLNIRMLDGAGAVIREIGRYGERPSSVSGERVTVPDLLDPDATRVYECKPGLSEKRAAEYGKAPGPTFHFALNDVILRDTRIPPKGFTNAAFAEHLSQPVGVEYADGQHWDDLDVGLPAGCRKVVARLLYETVTWEYIKFLVEENRTDDWGRKLYDAWLNTGRCPPSVVAEAEVAVP